MNSSLKSSAAWLAMRLLALLVFLAVSLASCGAVRFTAIALLHPEQTEFAGGEPPKQFLVAVANPEASEPEKQYVLLRWPDARDLLAKEPGRARLSANEYRWGGDSSGFQVLESSPSHQIVNAWRFGTALIENRYRVDAAGVTPLSFKTDGGVGFFIVLIPLYVVGLWLGLVASRRVLRAVRGAQALP